MSRTRALQKLVDYIRLFGWQGGALAVRSRIVKDPVTISARTSFEKHPLLFRLKTSDIPIAVQVFVNEEYRFIPKKSIRTVLDAGANTGFSSIYFANRFPDAQIVALEPEQTNVDLLRKNTGFCERIHPEQLALWNENVDLDVVDWFGKCGFRTKSHGEQMAREVCGAVPGISVPALMARYGWEKIDFLKMDIEGAETTVFSGDLGWLDHVGVLAVELHDWLDPNCSRVFSEVAQRFDVHWVQGENQFCAREAWV